PAARNLALPESQSDSPSAALVPTSGTTGRFLVVFTDDAVGQPRSMTAALKATADVTRFAMASDFSSGAVDSAQAKDADALVFDNLGIAVVTGDPSIHQRMAAAAADEKSNILAVEPERFVYACGW